MIRLLEIVIPRFSSERQVNDYLRDLYLPGLKDITGS
jgi:hypothetical protein